MELRMNAQKFRIISIAVFFLFILIYSLPAADGVFRSVSGKVEYRVPGESWKIAQVGLRVPTGAHISTGFNSGARLEIESAVLRIRSLTRMSIDELIKREGVISTEMNLRVGRVRAEVKGVEGLRTEFKVSSPVSTAAVRGTIFENDGVNLKVFEGSVRFTNPNNIGGVVSKGGTGTSTGDGPPLTGLASWENNNVVTGGTLPTQYSQGERQLTPFGSTTPLKEVEYGSISGTVSFH